MARRGEEGSLTVRMFGGDCQMENIRTHAFMDVPLRFSGGGVEELILAQKEFATVVADLWN